MRKINVSQISGAVAGLVKQASFFLRADVLSALRRAFLEERNSRAKKILKAVLDNAACARKEKLAICQDTGFPIVFIDLGQDVFLKGSLEKAVNKGIEEGYKRNSLRNSIVAHPLDRKGSGFSPCLIHTHIVKGDKVKITFLPKGFGCENKSRLQMFKPTASLAEIKDFIVGAVKDAGPDACPPYVVGVGIGGTADYSAVLAKKALLRRVSSKKSKLENDLLNAINKTGIGPMGLGGRCTALAVHVEIYPTHIAGLPVSVNISCHALRSASIVL